MDRCAQRTRRSQTRAGTFTTKLTRGYLMPRPATEESPLIGQKLENRLGCPGFGHCGSNQERHHYEQRNPRRSVGLPTSAHEWCSNLRTTNRSASQNGPGRDPSDYQPRTPGTERVTGITPTSGWTLHCKRLKIDSVGTQDSLRPRTGRGDSARGAAVQGPEPVQELGGVQ